ncbi:zinc finger, CCHC-type containing protein [Tanacetum coccineum]
MGKTVNELHAMLKLHEETLPKKVAAPAFHAIKARKVQKNKNKNPSKAAKGVQGKDKGKKAYANAKPSYAPKPKNPPPLKKDNPSKDAICHHCGEVGHWRMNCSTYLTELLKKKQLSPGASTLGIFTIELYSFPSTSWVYDTAVEAIGNYHLCLPSILVIVLNNCRYAPSITRGIILVSHLYEDGFINRFELNNAISVSKNNIVYFSVIPRDGVYEIEMSCSNTNNSSIKKRIEKLQHDGLLNSTDIESLGKCVSCMSGKMARKPYSHQVERAKDLLGLKHTNVFQKEVENQLRKTIKSLRSDRGGEYMSQEFLDNLKEHRIISHRTPPYTPQHNGVSERRNRTLLDMVCSMLSQTSLPNSFWDYALESAACILNMVPTKKVDKTPYEIWHGQALKLSYLKEMMGYSFYNPSENKVFVARNAEFFKSNLIDQEASGSVEDLEIIQEEDTNPSLDTSLNHEEDDQEIDEPQSDINPIRRSSRTKHAPNRMCLYIDAEEHMLGDLGQPANYKAALLDPESGKWLATINVEMQSMKDNDVWELVELPLNAKTVGHKWLFKKKTDMDGAIHTFKSRLIAKGFTQTYEVDYEETFSPVADIRAIRILIAIVAFYDYEIWQMDVKTTFLNEHPSEEVYMMQPKGFVNPKYPNHKILKRYYIENSKRGTIPTQEKIKLSKSDGASTPAEKRISNVPYASAVGSIMYANILKYIWNTKDMFLVYGGDMKRELRVSCYTDVGYLMDANDLKSQIGYVFVLNGDAEYIATFDASKEAVWIRKFISGLNVVPIIVEPITMYCDNTRAIAIANDHGVTKGA